MVRISDIVNKTGYSRATVSSVLNERYSSLGISEGTANKVRDAVRELGYVRNELSLSMKTGRSNYIGCIISSIHGEWGGRILEGALSKLKETNYSIRLSSAWGFENEVEALNHIIAGRVAGLFVSNINPEKEMVQKIHDFLAKYNIPVLSNNCIKGFSPARIEADNYRAGALAAEHLISLGHKKVAFIGGANHPTSEERKKGFLDSLKSGGIEVPLEWQLQGNWKIDPTEEATFELLSNKNSERPTAILAANHFMAAAVIRKASLLGLSVPKDISVIGITDESLCQITNPPMTTVALNESEIGSRAMELLVKMAENPELAKEEQCYLVEGRLIPRESTGIAPLS